MSGRRFTWLLVGPWLIAAPVIAAFHVLVAL
jgi:hypothetical protein